MRLGRSTSVLVIWALTLAGARAHPQGVPSAPADSFSYRTVAGRPLQLFRFPATADPVGAPANAILLFHGGGWSAGAPEWTFAAAREFASWGLVALPVQYRLATGSVTPLDALQDVCAAFAWVRTHQAQLGVTGRLAGYGVSAGGHLVAATSTVGCLDGDQRRKCCCSSRQPSIWPATSGSPSSSWVAAPPWRCHPSSMSDRPPPQRRSSRGGGCPDSVGGGPAILCPAYRIPPALPAPRVPPAGSSPDQEPQGAGDGVRPGSRGPGRRDGAASGVSAAAGVPAEPEVTRAEGVPTHSPLPSGVARPRGPSSWTRLATHDCASTRHLTGPPFSRAIPSRSSPLAVTPARNSTGSPRSCRCPQAGSSSLTRGPTVCGSLIELAGRTHTAGRSGRGPGDFLDLADVVTTEATPWSSSIHQPPARRDPRQRHHPLKRSPSPLPTMAVGASTGWPRPDGRLWVGFSDVTRMQPSPAPAYFTQRLYLYSVTGEVLPVPPTLLPESEHFVQQALQLRYGNVAYWDLAFGRRMILRGSPRASFPATAQTGRSSGARRAGRFWRRTGCRWQSPQSRSRIGERFGPLPLMGRRRASRS